MVVSCRKRIVSVLLLSFLWMVPQSSHAEVRELTDYEMDQIIGANLPSDILADLSETIDAESMVEQFLSLLTPLFSSELSSFSTLSNINAISSEVSVQINVISMFDVQDVEINQSNSIQIP